jgi:transglutaminase-like putative cysteine protease
MSSSCRVLPLLRGALLARTVVATVVVAFAMSLSTPLAAANNPTSHSVGAKPAGPPGPGQQLGQVLREVRSNLQETARGVRMGHSTAGPRNRLATLRSNVVELDTLMRAEFEEIEASLLSRQLPAKVLQRHQSTLQQYREQMDALLIDLHALGHETDSAVLVEIIDRTEERLSPGTLEQGPRPFDPRQLPHGPQLPLEENLPRVLKDEFVRSGLVDSPRIHLAALETYRLEGLPEATDPAFLGENPAVRLTPAIRAKAEDLGHDPVAIYHWVRNEVVWIPTWGVVQDSDLTLSMQSGNAMDIAGLLIALLRASGVPARFVHGTIDVPEEQFRNWIGDFDGVEAAMAFASSGGIPITGLVAGGRVVDVRMEHVWVEAAIDFLPSRGGVMFEADTWLPLDASFKQYAHRGALDFAAIADMDSAALAQEFFDSGILNEQEGWVQGLEANVLEQAQEHAKERLRQFIDALDQPTIGDLIGERRTVLRDSPILPSGLPYQRVVEGARYDAIPQELQTRISFTLGSGSSGAQALSEEFHWASLNNQKVTLSFRPATPDDEDALRALLPEGTLDGFSDLPDRIPAYLVEMVPELKVDGELVLTGEPVGLGSEMAFGYKVTDPVFGTRTYPNRIAAGSFLSVAVIGHQVSLGNLEKSGERLGNVASVLASGNDALLESLDRESLYGELFHAGLLSYFSQLGSIGTLSALTNGAHYQPTLSAGTFGYVPTVGYLFGIPHSITSGSVVMDLDRVAHIASTDGQGRDSWKNFNIQLGALASALEHAIPEQMFVPPGFEGEGVSAVKAIQKAIAQGQRVYHITPENLSQTLPNIVQSSLTINDIRDAVAAGREVLVHTHPIQVPGWAGAGYIILDPTTGAGAWKITGGANGGSLEPPIGSVETKWAILSEWGGDLGKVAAKSNTIFELGKTVTNLVTACSTKSAVAGIISITLVSTGFVLLGKAAVFFGPFVAIGYGAGAAVATSTVIKGWERSCRV